MKILKFEKSKNFPGMIELILSAKPTSDEVVNKVTGIAEVSLPQSCYSSRVLLNINLNNYKQEIQDKYLGYLAYIVKQQQDVVVELIKCRNIKLDVCIYLDILKPETSTDESDDLSEDLI
jgi:hypothetical protein